MGRDQEGGSGLPSPSDLALIVGLVVAFLLFVVVVAIVVKLVGRKGNGDRHHGYRLTPAGKNFEFYSLLNKGRGQNVNTAIKSFFPRSLNPRI